jgi:hypothetical protein
MSARHKLNAAYAAGSLLLAALIGGRPSRWSSSYLPC